MEDRHFSAAELAAHAGIPLRTITFFVNQGILEPSVQRAPGRGRSHVFDFADVLAAAMLNAVRFPNASAAPLRQLVRFWHTPAGRRLTESLRRASREDEPQILLITLEGVELNASPAEVMARHRSPVVYCVDATHFFSQLSLGAGERPELSRREPLPSPSAPAPSKPVERVRTPQAVARRKEASPSSPRKKA